MGFESAVLYPIHDVQLLKASESTSELARNVGDDEDKVFPLMWVWHGGCGIEGFYGHR